MRSLLTLSFLMVATVAVAGELPDVKDHEFNADIPTTFDGKSRAITGDGVSSFAVYETGPTSDAKAPALIVIHEWWGLNGHIKGVADQFGRLGYAVSAIDLYDGKVTDDPTKAKEYFASVDGTEAIVKLSTLVRELRKRHPKVGVIGWCFGGGWSLQTAIHTPVDAAVIYYGGLVADPMVLKNVKAPILGIFALKDGWITPEKVDSFVRAAKLAQVDTTILKYDADHAFANPSGDRFDEMAARDAWRHTVQFLEGKLGGRK